MDFLRDIRRNVSGRTVRVWLVALTVTLYVAGGLQHLDALSREAVVCEGVCRELLSKTTEGRQALVSSVWWAPMPFLLRLPFAALTSTQVLPLASLLVSALFGAVSLLFLERVLDAWKVPAVRWTMVLAVAIHPAYVSRCCDGSSGTTVVFLALVCAYGLVRWVARRQLRYLVYLSLAAALMVVTSFEMWPWLLVMYALMLIDLAAMATSRQHKEAITIMAFLPVAYAIGLWSLMNWLIMGDGLYFLRSLWAGVGSWQEVRGAAVTFSGVHLLVAVISVLTLVAAAQGRHLGGVFMGVVGLSPILVMNFLASRRLFWAPTAWEYTVFPLFVMVVGYMREFPSVISGRLKAAAAWLPAALTLVTLATGSSTDLSPSGTDGGYAAVLAERNQWLPKIERHVRAQTPYVKVFVCGYDSFFLLGRDAPPTFVHSLDFNFYRAKEDYTGHVLYLLVHRPAGRSAMDSIHWKHDRIFSLGSRETLYDGDWGNWRLFEIIQAGD